MSDSTKRALADALKKYLMVKPLDKITISDLTNECGVNRQTFYYHFKDIYDLIEWMYVKKAKQVFNESHSINSWKDSMLELFDMMRKDSNFVIRTYHSVTRESLENFLYQKTSVILKDAIDEILGDRKIAPADREFIADFYKYAFVGIVLDWVKKDMSEDPEVIISRIDKLVSVNFQESVLRFIK